MNRTGDDNYNDLYNADDVKLVKNAVRSAGELALEYFQKDLNIWEKSPDNPVSVADIDVDKFLKKLLLENRPNYGWLSEESDDNTNRLDKQRVWIVDPIDGTRAFINGRNDWGVSAALVENGEPVIGVFYAPARDSYYFAQKNQGAFHNNKRLMIKPASSLSSAHMLGNPTAFRHKTWPVSWPETMKTTGINSIALRLCMVADGTADCCVTLRPKNDWDVAAGDLIVREAGGRVINSERERLAFNRPKPVFEHIIAAHEDLVNEIMDRVTAALDGPDTPKHKP